MCRAQLERLKSGLRVQKERKGGLTACWWKDQVSKWGENEEQGRTVEGRERVSLFIQSEERRERRGVRIQGGGRVEGGGGAATPEKFTVSTVIPRLELKDV